MSEPPSDGPRPRVLIVDDEPPIIRVLKPSLVACGYEVLIAETGAAALSQIAQTQPDVIILDLGLPDMDGKRVIEQMREWSEAPIVVLSARHEAEERIASLDIGADDYVTKPFVTKELSARIRAQLRRTSSTEVEPAPLTCGQLELHPDTAEVLLRGEPIMLSRIEFRVLQELLLARGRVLSRDELLRRVWGYGNAGDGRVVDNLIYRLRSKIEDDPANPAHLVTVRGFGYRLKD